MKQKRRTTRLAFISALVGIVYFSMLFVSVLPHAKSFMEGFKEGVSLGQNSVKRNTSLINEVKIPASIALETKNDNRLKGNDSIYNEKLREMQPASIDNLTIFYTQKKMPASIAMIIYLSPLALLILTALSILVPIKFIEMIASISKDEIFIGQNIRRLRLIGIFLLSIFLFYLGMNTLDFYLNRALFQFENYRIKMIFPDLMWLFLSGISFLLAEVFDKAKRLKEEQDLTV